MVQTVAVIIICIGAASFVAYRIWKTFHSAGRDNPCSYCDKCKGQKK
jgi:hypothetical protein